MTPDPAQARAQLGRVLKILSDEEVQLFSAFDAASYRGVPALVAAIIKAVGVEDGLTFTPSEWQRIVNERDERVERLVNKLDSEKAEAVARARREAIEECAKLCDEAAAHQTRKAGYKHITREDVGQVNAQATALEAVGKRIRALAARPEETEQRTEKLGAGGSDPLSTAANRRESATSGLGSGAPHSSVRNVSVAGTGEALADPVASPSASPAGAAPSDAETLENRQRTQAGTGQPTGNPAGALEPAPPASASPAGAAPSDAETLERAAEIFIESGYNLNCRTVMDLRSHAVELRARKSTQLRQPPAAGPDVDVFERFHEFNGVGPGGSARTADNARAWFGPLVEALQLILAFSKEQGIIAEAHKALAALRARCSS